MNVLSVQYPIGFSAPWVRFGGIGGNAVSVIVITVRIGEIYMIVRVGRHFRAWYIC